jgi:hypothetical protein
MDFPEVRFETTTLQKNLLYKNFLRDMGTHGSPPSRVPDVSAKWTRSAKNPADLQVGPRTLSTYPTTTGDLILIPKDLRYLEYETRHQNAV